MARRDPQTLLNKVDLPTLGRPANTTEQSPWVFFLDVTIKPAQSISILTAVNYSTYDL
jgi:hypothetical protein